MKLRILNKTLNPKVWDEEGNLNKEIRLELLKIAKDFYKDTELKAPIKDIQLLGSLANYNWSEYSDLDLHVLIDFKDLKMENDYAKKFTNALKYRWNSKHEIEIQGHNVETYIQDVNETNAATGVFSLLNNQWIKKPVLGEIEIDRELIKKKYSNIVEQIRDLEEKFQNGGDGEISKKAKALQERIANLRNNALKKEGEFSNENIVFKLLRNSGNMERLIDLINNSYDSQFDEIN